MISGLEAIVEMFQIMFQEPWGTVESVIQIMVQELGTIVENVSDYGSRTKNFCGKCFRLCFKKKEVLWKMWFRYSVSWT